MPGATTGRLCPICDSPIEKGAKKCSFCGTDLTIFDGEAESALTAEDQTIKQSFAEMEAKAQKPAAPEAPRIEPAQRAQQATEQEAIFECPACGEKVRESDKTCPHCGAIFSEEAQFQCPVCETMVNADANKCPSCGAIFVEDEVAEAPAQEAQVAVATEIKAPIEVAEAKPVAEVAIEKDEDLDRIKSVTSKIRDSRKAEKAAKAEAVPKKKIRRGFSFFGGRGKEEVSIKETPKPEAGKPTAASKAPTPAPTGIRDIAAPSTAHHATPVAAPEIVAPAVKKQFPTDPREQGKELARLVAEVRALLGTAIERGIFIDETKALLDKAITAGRERQFVQALEVISEGEDKLNHQLKEYVTATLVLLQEEITVAHKLGGNPSRAEVFAKEAARAGETSDFQAALVFIDKAKNELAPVTGQYNDTKESLRKFERLVKDARVVGIDNEPLKEIYDDAKLFFDDLDFAKTNSIIKKTSEEIIAQIPEMMNKEIEKAKQMLIEAKMKSESGVTPQIAILKSAIRAMKEEKYLDALTELKRFKKEVRKILNPT